MTNNKRTKKNTTVPPSIESHETAAWANRETILPGSNVRIPNHTEVRNAKDWVDANQK